MGHRSVQLYSLQSECYATDLLKGTWKFNSARYIPLLAGGGRIEQTTRNTLAPETYVCIHCARVNGRMHKRTSVTIIVTCLSPLFKKRWVTTVVNYEMWHCDIYRLIGCYSNKREI